ncbi:MAG: FadR/GntR family transcriptional regulator [Coriobacteriales bacterium]|jgi:GntR family transcriptional repressor for pyruvate dehydrogenase complex
MPFNELVAPSRTTLFIKNVEEMILSGELKVGDKLPTERELSEKMKVSRAVINTGINRLAQMGFLEVAPRKGVFVADYIRNGNIDVLVALIEYNGGYFHPELIDPILQFHRSIEPYALEQAAINATPEQIDEMEEIIKKIKCSQNASESAALMFEFFHSAAIAGGNIVWPLLVQTLKSSYIASSKIFFQNGHRDEFVDGLENMFLYVKEGKSEEAKKLCERSIDIYGTWLKKEYRQEGTKEAS